MQYISTNKYEFNVRKVDELSEAILMKEAELANAKGLIEVIRVKLELRKLNRSINNYGSEILRYEQNKIESDSK